MALDCDDDWDDDDTSWRWRALRVFRSYDVYGPLPPSPEGLLHMPDGYLVALTAWPTNFTADLWREVSEAMVELAKELTT